MACEFLVERFERFLNCPCGFNVLWIQKGYAEVEMGLSVAWFELHTCLRISSVCARRPSLLESTPSL